MRLDELKSGLINQFFAVGSQGVRRDDLLEPLVKLRSIIGAAPPSELPATVGSQLTENLERKGSVSNDPSKAFAQFISGREATLSIIEESGVNQLSIFTAVRIGKNVASINLTEGLDAGKKSDLATIKQALKQAKNIDDEIYFTVVHWD